MRDYAMIYRTLCEDLRPFVRERTARGFAVRAQLRNFYKKLSPGVAVPPLAAKAALKKFIAINSSIEERFTFRAENESDHQVFRYFVRNFRETLDYSMAEGANNLDVTSALRHIGIGPGASLGSRSESFYTKLFDGDLVGTDPYLLSYYRTAICEHRAWADAEMHRSQHFGFQLVEGNRLFFVPKTTEIARTCCTEPILNMMIQKVIGGFIEERLQQFFGIRLEVQQELNRRLCRIGSLNGSFATIDLTSASDSISWSLIQQICPAYLTGLMAVARSPVTILPDGSRLTLKMISTMGNGFTFPLQTVLFACAVRAVYQQRGLRCADPGRDFAVNGDDIIVHTSAYADVVRLITKLGFQVNDKKSFSTGPFRESCGADYWNGVPVRSTYIRSLEDISDLYSALNRLARWSVRSDVPIFNTYRLLYRMVPKRPVPVWEDDSAGIKTPYRCLQDRSITRKYACLAPIPLKVPIPEDGSTHYLDFNPDGVYTSILAGYAASSVGRKGSSQHFTVRRPPGRLPMKVEYRSAPYWDWPAPHVDDVSVDRWKAIVTGYITYSEM